MATLILPTVVSPVVLLRGWVVGSSLPLPSICPVAPAIPDVQLGGKRGAAPGLWSWEAGWPSLAEADLQPVFRNTMCCRNRGPSAFFMGFFGFFSSLNSGVIPGINLALACIISTVFIMSFFCAEQLDFCLVV